MREAVVASFNILQVGQAGHMLCL